MGCPKDSVPIVHGGLMGCPKDSVPMVPWRTGGMS